MLLIFIIDCMFVHGVPKSKLLPNDQRIVLNLNRVKACQWD